MPLPGSAASVAMAPYRVDVLHGHAHARAHRVELEQVACAASDNNIFHEPWMLLAAMQAFDAEVVSVLMVRDATGVARGYLPVSRTTTGLGAVHLASWRHPYCYLCTPLIADGHVEAVVGALLDWLDDGASSASCLDLHDIAADSAFASALSSVLAQRRRLVHDRTDFERALLVPSSDNDEAPSPKRRRKWRRLERRLAVRGHLAYTRLQPGEDAAPWIERFLALEASGWKGRAGSALAATTRARGFFIAIAEDAHRQGRLDLRALELDGVAIAMQCNFLAGTGAYAFKVAYDERHADASPGLQLEVHAMRHLAVQDPQLRWMDSCARPDHAMMNRLWLQRRTISRFVIASRGSPAIAWIVARRASRIARRIWRVLREGLRRRTQAM